MMKCVFFFSIAGIAASSIYDAAERSELGAYEFETLEGEYGSDDTYAITALSGDGEIMAVGQPYNYIEDVFADVKVYRIESDLSLTQMGQNISFPSDSMSISQNGTVVALGHVGGNSRYNNGGLVEVFEMLDNETWIQRGQTIEYLVGSSDKTGFDISISSNGDILAVSAPRANSNTGVVQVFQYDSNANTWNPRGSEIVGSSFGSRPMFGTYVDMSSDGEYLAVGLSGLIDIGKSGAYVLHWNGTSNEYEFENGQIESTDTFENGANVENGYFNIPVSIDSTGHTLIVGNSNYRQGDYYGRVSVYQKNHSNGVWIRSESILGQTSGTSGERFGSDVYVADNGTKFLVYSSSLLYMSNNKLTSFDLVGENEWKVSSIRGASMDGSTSADLERYVSTQYGGQLSLASYVVAEHTTTTTTASPTTTTTTSPTITTTLEPQTTESDNIVSTSSQEDDDDDDNDSSSGFDPLEGDVEDILILVGGSVALIVLITLIWYKVCRGGSKADASSGNTSSSSTSGKQFFTDVL
jgi:hypothetical protein